MSKRITEEEKIVRNLEKSKKEEELKRRKNETENRKSQKLLEYINRKYDEYQEEIRKSEKEESDFIENLKAKANFEYEKVLHFCKKINNYDTEFRPVIDNLRPTMQNILQHEGKSFIILKALGSISDLGYEGVKKITSDFTIRKSIFSDMEKAKKTYDFSDSLSTNYDINLSKEEIKDLFQVRLSTSKQSSGDGEFLAALILGGQMPQEGDIMVDDEIIEVKSSGGGGFYGFYGPNSNNYVKSKYSEMISKSKEMGIPENLLLPAISRTGKRSWNMSRGGGSKSKNKNWGTLREWMRDNLTEGGIQEFKLYLFPLLFGMFKYNTEEEIRKVVDDFFSFKIDRREFHCRLAFFAADSYCHNGSGGSFEKILFFNKWNPWETMLFIKENEKFYNEENISRFLSTNWDINLNFSKENGNIEVVDANGGK
jgi:hypothetical protein